MDNKQHHLTQELKKVIKKNKWLGDDFVAKQIAKNLMLDEGKILETIKNNKSTFEFDSEKNQPINVELKSDEDLAIALTKAQIITMKKEW